MFNDPIKSMSQWGILGILALLVVAPAWGASVYLETFDGGNYELNGTAPDIAPSGVVWEAGSDILADGSLASQCMAVLPFEPEIGEVYQVIAEFDQGGDWAAVGFFEEMPADLNARLLENALLWALVRENGDTEADQAFMGPGTADGLGDASTSSAAEIRIRLETTSETEWTVTWIFDGSEDFQETINPEDYPIHYVAFGTNGYYSTVTGNILSFELRDSTSPYVASNPTPADTATDVYVQEALKWIPGDAAVSRNVYFSEDLASVEAGSADAMIAEALDVNELALDDPFELGVTYYWRVDEVNGAPDYGLNEGFVWSFTAEPVGFVIDPCTITATASSANDGSGPEKTTDSSGLDEAGQHSTDGTHMWLTDVDDPEGPWIQYEFDKVYKLNEIEIWNANPNYEAFMGMGVKQATIEVSVDGETWTTVYEAADFNQASGAATYTANTYVDMNEALAKFVRITPLDHFSTVPTVTNVGLSEVRFYSIPTEARLPEPADGATVNKMTVNLSWRSARDVSLHDLYFGTDPNALELASSSDEVGYTTDLEYDRTYYWRVDEVIDGETHTGPVWSFSTLDYVIIDDMESYTNDDGSLIYETWSDSYDDYIDTGLGCMVGHETEPYAEQELVFNGSQSMPVYYGVSSSVDAKAELTLDKENWTVGGLTTLTLYVLGERGSSENTTLFVELDGNRQSTDLYLAGGIWKQVNFPLAGFNTNLSSIESLVIGVEGTGTGTMYIDDISLYREVSEAVTPSDPGDDALVLWYEMENDLSDSAGDYTGTSELTLFYRDSLEGLGSAVELDGLDNYISMPIDSLIAGLGDSSFMGWIQIDSESTAAWQRLFDMGTGTDNYFFVSPRRETAGTVRAAILRTDDEAETGITSEDALTDGWHHLAVTFDTGLMTLYIDGWSAGNVETDITPQDMGATTQNWLGKSMWDSDGLLMGMIDDFRIYERGLSESEVRYIAGDR